MEGTSVANLPDFIKDDTRRDLIAYQTKFDEPETGYFRRPLWPECIHHLLETYRNDDILRATERRIKSMKQHGKQKAHDFQLAIKRL